MNTDRQKRRLKEFEKIKRTGTSTEFDNGSEKAIKVVLKNRQIMVENLNRNIRTMNLELVNEAQNLGLKGQTEFSFLTRSYMVFIVELTASLIQTIPNEKLRKEILKEINNFDFDIIKIEEREFFKGFEI